jgi:hypothetical protein
MEKTETKKDSILVWVKQILLALFTILSFILLWYFLSKIFRSPERAEALYSLTFNSFEIWLFPLLATLCAAILIGLSGLFLKKTWLAALTYFFSVFSALLFFCPYFIYLAFLALLFSLLLIAYYRMLDEKRNLLYVRIQKITRMGIPLTLTGIILFTSSLYYKNLTLKAAQENLIVPSEIIAPFEKPILNLASSMTPGYKEDLTLREYLAFTISMEISKDPEILRIFPDVFQAFASDYDPTAANIEKLIQEDEEFRKVLTQKINESKPTWSFGKPIEEKDLTSDLLVSDFILKTFKSKINEVVTPYQKSLPLFFAILFFFTLKLISFFIALLAYVFEFIIFQILKALKIIKITREAAEKELIEI